MSRSVPSDLFILKAFVGLIVEYGFDLINIVYVNDEYGQSVTTALVDLSKGGLSLNNTNTELLQMDENGDRIGARIPVFFITLDGTAEKFAVYEGGSVSFLQEPLWPG